MRGIEGVFSRVGCVPTTAGRTEALSIRVRTRGQWRLYFDSRESISFQTGALPWPAQKAGGVSNTRVVEIPRT